MNVLTSGSSYAVSFGLIGSAFLFQIYVMQTGGGMYGNSERYIDEDDAPLERMMPAPSPGEETPFDLFRMKYATAEDEVTEPKRAEVFSI